MKLSGKYYKDGSFWLTEIPFIDFMDQGKTKAEALKLAKSAIQDLVNVDGFSCEIEDAGHGEFFLSSNDSKTLSRFVIRRMRESKGLSIRDVGTKLGLSSHTEYARHESGKTAMTLETFNRYVKALSDKDIVLQIA